tara:strand:+ start:777 stop:1040 length:264 start_codon:yes stop_codon:yes gene_type:complete
MIDDLGVGGHSRHSDLVARDARRIRQRSEERDDALAETRRILKVLGSQAALRLFWECANMAMSGQAKTICAEVTRNRLLKLVEDSDE